MDAALLDWSRWHERASPDIPVLLQEVDKIADNESKAAWGQRPEIGRSLKRPATRKNASASRSPSVGSRELLVTNCQNNLKALVYFLRNMEPAAAVHSASGV